MNLNNHLEENLKNVPGGVALIVLDDLLTVLHGTDTFCSLIQNIRSKSNLKFPLALLRVVYSADIIYVTQQLAQQRQREDGMFRINFRILQDDGHFKWVMISGNKTMEEYTSGNKAYPVYSCIAMDVSDHMMDYKRLEQMVECYRVISELSKDLYFEYEIATDSLIFNDLFYEMFGKESKIKNFRKKLEKNKIVHPEELPAVIKIFDTMMTGKKQVRFEVQLNAKEGGYIPYTCYASMIFDENKNPSKVVGKLDTKGRMGSLNEKALMKLKKDTLTGVYNKESVMIAIKDAMDKQKLDALSSLMFFEIRNFKGMNEIMAEHTGESVLTQIANLIKTVIRTTDIIGRVSMSEFMVYITDIPSPKIVYGIADYLCSKIDDLYGYKHSKNALSMSIGIAFHKGSQMDFNTLKANANTALIMARKEHGSSFEVFYD